MQFPTTHWSVLAKATVHGESDARAALEILCQRYWVPVHSFVRSHGFADPEAQDLTQGFMVHVIEKSIFTRADRLQGRFRSFLLGALTRYLSDTLDRRRAIKRGGAAQHVSLEVADTTQELDHSSTTGPRVSAFDREWALTILETALARLRSECAEPQRGNNFEVLKDFLPGAAETCSYETAAGRLGITVGALKSEIHRLRQRLRALVRAEVARTVSTPHEIEDEMAHLQNVLMDRGSLLSGSEGNFSCTNPEK
jgi:RNA polymerase sigma-70 factor (ECF subfamily)